MLHKCGCGSQGPNLQHKSNGCDDCRTIIGDIHRLGRHFRCDDSRTYIRRWPVNRGWWMLNFSSCRQWHGCLSVIFAKVAAAAKMRKFMFNGVAKQDGVVQGLGAHEDATAMPIGYGGKRRRELVGSQKTL